MKRLFIYSIFLLVLSSCAEIVGSDNSQAKYSYSVQSWENVGSQTLVNLGAQNPSHLDQNLSFTVEAINKEGKKFTKDTAIHFSEDENEKNFQLVLDTNGEIEKVKATVNEI